ncbi:MAG: ABC transporter substrate-binding protein [Pseudomonadota bacterium]
MDINAIYAIYSKRALSLCVYYVSMFAVALLVSASVFGIEQVNSSENKNYNRIVSIGGSLTEIIYALGEDKRLIARDTTSVFPREAFELPDVGYIRQLSPEGVLSVDPDLILALEGSGPPETIETLKAAGVPIVFVPEGYTDEKIREKILAVGKAMNVEGKAETLANNTSEALAEVSSRISSTAENKKVLFVLSMQGGKLLASGKNTAADGIISLAGGENIISSFNGYRQINDEAVISSQPDVILMMKSRGNHSLSDAEVLSHPAIATTPAGQTKNLVRMDGLFMLGFGPRTADAVSELFETLNRSN